MCTFLSSHNKICEDKKGKVTEMTRSLWKHCSCCIWITPCYKRWPVASIKCSVLKPFNPRFILRKWMGFEWEKIWEQTAVVKKIFLMHSEQLTHKVQVVCTTCSSSDASGCCSLILGEEFMVHNLMTDWKSDTHDLMCHLQTAGSLSSHLSAPVVILKVASVWRWSCCLPSLLESHVLGDFHYVF